MVQTYLLSPESPVTRYPQVSGKEGRTTLVVSLPQAQAGYDTARMVYLKRPHELSYYAVNQWADTPARMLHPLLAQALERTGSFKAVVQTPSVVRGDYRLDVAGLALEQEFFDQPSRVRLSLRIQIVELKSLGVVGTREFEALEEAPSDDAYGGVIAANRAVGRILNEVANWVRSLMNEVAPSP
jgi:cholesterol transport system auxiliary component